MRGGNQPSDSEHEANMSTTENTATETTPTPTPTPADLAKLLQQGDPAPAQPAEATDDEPLREAGKKALERERAAREAAEKALADLRREIEDSKKSAEQKAAEALAEAQRVAEENAARALRYEVAAEKGLPLDLATRLTGGTKDELLADADKLMAFVQAPVAKPQPVPGEGRSTALPLNGDGIESALKNALGIS